MKSVPHQRGIIHPENDNTAAAAGQLIGKLLYSLSYDHLFTHEKLPCSYESSVQSSNFIFSITRCLNFDNLFLQSTGVLKEEIPSYRIETMSLETDVIKNSI